VDGILSLDKPRGWTSHDVVAHVRRLTCMRRVGHAGTLDPLATGVLLVCLGRATRITEYLMAGRKRYRAVLRLGVSTASHDADGQVTATAPVTVGRAQVEAALSFFRGTIQQVPPMVSAVKRDGQPLYKLARRGITVERAARPVEIYDLTLLACSLPSSQPHAAQTTAEIVPSLTLELTCSPGTYVRALARDLGQRLGCGAHLTSLTRLASGDFTLDRALELERFTQAVAVGDWHAMVWPIDAGLKHFPACTLGVQESHLVQSGRPLPATLVVAPQDQLCRAYAVSDKKLLALLKFDEDARLWRPHKVFHPLTACKSSQTCPKSSPNLPV
jgi:tRNA pseudouridine55 synthase